MGDKQLLTRSARWRVRKRIWLGNDRIRTVRFALRQAAKGQQVAVLGSAPGGTLPSAGGGPLFCVNGSPGIAGQAGMVPDVTVIGGYTTSARRPEVQASLDGLRGRRSDTVVFIEHGDKAEAAERTLADLGFAYDRFLVIDALDRAAIIRSTMKRHYGLGERDDRISMGVFAIVLGVWAGAASVRVHGISLASGHAFSRESLPRPHVAGDTACLAELASRGLVDFSVPPETLLNPLQKGDGGSGAD